MMLRKKAEMDCLKSPRAQMDILLGLTVAVFGNGRGEKTLKRSIYVLGMAAKGAMEEPSICKPWLCIIFLLYSY
jgi:hypothetical protein